MSDNSVEATDTTESDNLSLNQQRTPRPSDFDRKESMASASQLPTSPSAHSRGSMLPSSTLQLSTLHGYILSETPQSPTSQLATRYSLSPSQLTDATSLKTDTPVTQGYVSHPFSRLFRNGVLDDYLARLIMSSALERMHINHELRRDTYDRLRRLRTAPKGKFFEFEFKLPRKWRPGEPDAHILEFEELMSRASDKLTVDLTLPGCSEQRWRFPHGKGLDTVTFIVGSNYKKIDSFALRGTASSPFYNPERPYGPNGLGTDEDPVLGKLHDVLRECDNVTGVIQISSLDPEAFAYPEISAHPERLDAPALPHRDFGFALTLCNDTTVVDLSKVNELTVAALSLMTASWAKDLAINDHWELKFVLPRSMQTNATPANATTLSSLRTDLSRYFNFKRFGEGNPIPADDRRFDPEQYLRSQIRDAARSVDFPASFAPDGAITDLRPGTEADLDRLDKQIEFI